MKTYKFILTLDDNTKRVYHSTTYQALYEYLYNDKRKDFELYNIRDVTLIYKSFVYTSNRDHKKYLVELTKDQYDKYLNEYNYSIMSYNYPNVDTYIEHVYAYYH